MKYPGFWRDARSADDQTLTHSYHSISSVANPVGIFVASFVDYRANGNGLHGVQRNDKVQDKVQDKARDKDEMRRQSRTISRNAHRTDIPSRETMNHLQTAEVCAKWGCFCSKCGGVHQVASNALDQEILRH